MDNALEFVKQILTIAPGLVKAGIDISNLFNTGREVLESGTDPTAQQWDELNDFIAQRRAILHSPDA